MMKVRKNAKIRIQSSTIPYPDTIWKSDKTQGHITHKRAKRSAFSKQMIRKLQETAKADFIT